MPELPEVEALAQFLRDMPWVPSWDASTWPRLSVLKTFDPPITSLQGRNVTGADRFGKHLALDCDGLWLIAHLSRGGWLRWIDNPGSAPPNPARGPLAVRVHF
ncbi:Fpg/Nei family DNA glycosylase, partial [Rhodococcus hoagii]|nr:Fpg/Nei family DNA glycosylase [Prescottella equi]